MNMKKMTAAGSLEDRGASALLSPKVFHWVRSLSDRLFRCINRGRRRGQNFPGAFRARYPC